METELKLNIAPSEHAGLREHHLLAELATAPPVEHELHDIYYDTPRLDLWRHGLTLRVRAEGGRWIQTVKTAAQGSAGLHQRGEWECELAGPEPDAAALTPQIKSSRIIKLLRAPALVAHLRPVFKNTIRRTLWNIELPDGQQVECALDAGDLQAGNSNAVIGELELEIKRGDPAQLFEFALALHEDIPLEIANDSKAARGYAMLDGAAPRPIKAQPVHLAKKMRLEAALQCMGLNCLQQMEANVPGVLKQSVESLHQMRVGVRRLRALLDMFGDLAPLPAAMRDSLDWLAGELGATRDWDVLANSTIPDMGGRDLSGLASVAAARAGVLHQNIVEVLHQPRYTELLLRLNGWFHGRQWRQGARLEKNARLARPAHVAMKPLLRKAQRRLHKRLDGLDQSDAGGRHRVRIAAKKARYAAEFFHDLLPGKRVKHFIATLSGLQDRLGHLNDLAVARHLLAELEQTAAAPDLMYARGYVHALSECESAHLKSAFKAVESLNLTG